MLIEGKKVLGVELESGEEIRAGVVISNADPEVTFGKLIGREYFILEGTEDTTDNEVMGEFVKQFYTEAANIPEQVMLPQEIEEAKIIGQWLRSKRGGEKVEFFVPKEGQPQELVKMASENATETLQALRAQ